MFRTPSTLPSVAPAPKAAPAVEGTLPVTRTADFAVAPPQPGGPQLDAEKLIAYHLALELQALCSSLAPGANHILRDQLDRASLSVVLNLAEGAGRYSRKQKRHFYGIARGSATEVAAAVDVVRVRQLAAPGACYTVRSLAVRVVQLLTKLDASLA